MDVIINLEFDKSTMRLAGYPYGKSVYNEQVKDKLDFTKKNVIVFPDQIVRIASSFVQGFFEEIIEKQGLSSIGNAITIKIADKRVYDSIVNNLI